MKSRKLGFAIFAALSLHATSTGAQEQPQTTISTTTVTTAVDTTSAIAKIGYFVGDVASPIRAGSQEMDVGSQDPSQLPKFGTGLSEGRGKKKKKIKNSMNMLIGGSMMAAFVVIFMFLNMITVTLGKALFFTFIAKFLVSVNWKSSESSSKKKSSHNDITVVMT